jgi:prepilin-type N-terminal cleavage/methylation domain-containing protein
MKTCIRNINKQAGMTLMEILAALAIIASVLVGALSLFGSASTSQGVTQLNKDIVSVRTAIQQMSLSVNNYGTASLNSALIASKKVPQTFTVSGTTLTLPNGNGTLTVTGLTATTFNIVLAAIPSDTCLGVINGATAGWVSVAASGGTALAATAPPISLANAATACSGGTGNAYTVTLVSN